MLRKYKIIYKAALRFDFTVIEAASKYAAKQLFYRQYPRYEIVSLREAARECT